MGLGILFSPSNNLAHTRIYSYYSKTRVNNFISAYAFFFITTDVVNNLNPIGGCYKPGEKDPSTDWDNNGMQCKCVDDNWKCGGKRVSLS